ncbi:MAG: hypothetical protein Q9223_001631 [Gallowayella weberi]
MAGRYKPFAKAVMGCLGLTAVQQVGIDIDPITLSHVEEFLFDVLETLPADDKFPSAGFSTVFSTVKLLGNQWAAWLFLTLLLMAISMLFGLYVGQLNRDQANIRDRENRDPRSGLWPQGALIHASRPINRRRRRHVDQTSTRKISPNYKRTFSCIQRLRQRFINRGYRRTVAADKVELVTGTTMPATQCSLTVPVYRNIYIDVGVLFTGSDAERMLFALLLPFMFTSLVQGLALNKRQFAAAYGHVQRQLKDQGVDLATALACLMASEDSLVEGRARNVVLESGLAEHKQLCSNQKKQIINLRAKVKGANTRISVLMRAITKLFGKFADQKQLSGNQKQEITTLHATVNEITSQVAVQNGTIKKLFKNKDGQIQELQAQLAAQIAAQNDTIAKLFKDKVGQIQRLQAQLAAPRNASPRYTLTTKGEPDDPAPRTAKKGPPGPFDALKTQTILDLRTANSKQAIRIIELKALAENQSSSRTVSAGPSATDSSSTLPTQRHSSANNGPPTNDDGINAPSGNTGKAIVKLPVMNRANNEPPTNNDGTNAPSGNTGKATVKLPDKNPEPGDDTWRTGGVSRSTIPGETQSQYDQSVRIAPLPSVIHHPGQKPYTDRKNAQGQDQDHPHHNGTGDGSQAAEEKPHKRYRRGRRKPRHLRGLAAGVEGTSPGSEAESLPDDDDQNTEAA